MKIALTSDVELWSWNKNFERDIEKGVLKLVELVEKEKIPITFFISLSDKGYYHKDYLEKISNLFKKIKSKYVSLGIHTHCKNIPVGFPTQSDKLKDYSIKKIIEILNWNKKELEKISKKKIIIHRAGSYAIPKLNVLDECFKETGLKIDSSDISLEYSNILRLKNLKEIPPATNNGYSKKLRIWSPEQMTLHELADFYAKSKSYTKLLVINFHSFSTYGSLKGKNYWYALPSPLRLMLRPFTRSIKKIRGIKTNGSANTSENFIKLSKLIKFLKRDKCKFVGMGDIK